LIELNIKIKQEEQMKRLDYQPSDSNMVYIWALILPMITSLIISVCAYGSPTDTDGAYLIYKETWFLCFLRVLSAGLLIGLFFIYNKSKKISGFKASGLTTKTNYLNIAFCIILGIGIVYFTSPIITIISYLLSLTGLDIQTGIDLPLNTVWDYLLTLLLIGILPAVTEELIYRGVIFKGMKKWGKWPAILLSALAFCLMHGSIEQFAYTFLLGVVLGYIMWETGALWLCMIIHFCNNATVLTSMFIATQTGESSALPTTVGIWDILYAVGMLAIAVGLVILIFYLMKKVKKRSATLSASPLINSTTKQTATITPTAEVSANKSVAEVSVNKNLLAKENRSDLFFLLIGFGLAIILTIIQTI